MVRLLKAENRPPKFSNYIEMVYCPTLFFIKTSIALQLIHIFAPTRHGAMYWTCYLYIWLSLIYYSALLIAAIFACWPRAKLWDPLLPGKCANINATLIVTAVINTISDLVLLFVPLACVWTLQMSSNRKWGISAVFATGAL